MTSLNPVFTWEPDPGGHPHPPGPLQERGPGEDRAGLARRRYRQPGAEGEGVPAPVLGRHAPARHDRDGTLCNPKVLIADEPTTALDVTIQAQILELMVDLQEKYGTAIIMISHDLGVVAQIADKVTVMYAGRAVEQGTTDEIFYDPLMPYSWSLLGSLPASIPRARSGSCRYRACRRPLSSCRRAATSTPLPVRQRRVPRDRPRPRGEEAGTHRGVHPLRR